jgi:AcrR family transcriptional regulator
MSLRADAVRSRDRILAVARTHDVRGLRLNDVARDAGVGVATVYRHFPTVRALVEALSADALERLCEAAEAAASEPDAFAALCGFVDEALALQLDSAGLQTVLADLERVDPEVHTACSAARSRVHDGYAAVLARAQLAGAARRDLTPARLQQLVSGVEHAVRLGAPGDRTVLLDVLLTGIRA